MKDTTAAYTAMELCTLQASTRDARDTLGKVSEDNDHIRESGFERADVLRVTVLA